MKRAIILLNGEPFEGEIHSENVYAYCCDGAYSWAKDKIKIDENLGDFDSLGYLPDPPPSEIYPSEKDYTDGELALMRAVAAGFHKIEIYGGGGRREDHFVGNLHLLYRACKLGVQAELVTNYARIFAATGEVRFPNCKGKTISVAPFGGSLHIMESKGFHYPLPKTFEYGFTVGISNVVESDEAYFTAEGVALVFIDYRA